MSSKLYVSSLPWAVTTDALKDMFAEVGVVRSARVILDKETGKSRGFGFVEMGSDKEAQNAISKYNKTQLEGRTIYVQESIEKERKPQQSFNGNRQY